MPYFQHEDFRDYYLDLSIQEIKIYMRILLDSMAYIHENFIIHRDVKPSNFLFNRDQKKGMLVDFGLAQVLIRKYHDISWSTRKEILLGLENLLHNHLDDR